MDKSDFGITNYSVLEQVVHVMHMAELWTDAKEFYDLMKISPPAAALCECVSDLEATGVMSDLELLALKIKYPGLTSGVPTAPRRGSKGSKGASAYEISYTLKADAMNRPRVYTRALRNFDFEGDEDDVVERAMEQLEDGDQGLDARLDGEEGWGSWRQGKIHFKF